MGIEPAAALLTLLLQLSLFMGAWLLARSVTGASLALLGLCMVVVVPGDYGPDRIFTCVESFLTPRMAGEALTLCGLAAALSARPALAMALVVLAAVIHPVMAAAGVAALFFLYVAIPHRRTTVLLVALLTIFLLASAFGMPSGKWGRFDDTWLALIRDRSPYLFLSFWRLDDWSRAAVTLVTLSVGAGALKRGRAHSLCVIALLVTAGGLVLTLVACDFLHLVLFTQLQPWRWQWLGTVAAAIMLPQILRSSWLVGWSGRSTAILLVSAWIFALDEFALLTALTTVISFPFLRRLTPRHAQLVFWGACGVLVIAIVWRVASNLEFTDAHYVDARIPLSVRRLTSFVHDGAIPMAVILLAWWLGRSPRRRVGLMVLAARRGLSGRRPDSTDVGRMDYQGVFTTGPGQIRALA